MCMAGTQNMTMGAADPSGGMNYNGPYTATQAPPATEDGSPPPTPTPRPEGAGDNNVDEAKVWDYTKVADKKR